MSTTAPKPPTKNLLAAAGLTGGATLAIFAMTWVGHVMYDNIPTGRLVIYTLAWVAGAIATACLAGRYRVQKQRRDAWWDGFAAGDEPLAEVIPLRDLKGYEGSNMRFINGSPS